MKDANATSSAPPDETVCAARPVVAKTFPILEAAQANALLESGQVTGNVVLLAPELL